MIISSTVKPVETVRPLDHDHANRTTAAVKPMVTMSATVTTVDDIDVETEKKLNDSAEATAAEVCGRLCMCVCVCLFEYVSGPGFKKNLNVKR